MVAIASYMANYFIQANHIIMYALRLSVYLLSYCLYNVLLIQLYPVCILQPRVYNGLLLRTTNPLKVLSHSSLGYNT